MKEYKINLKTLFSLIAVLTLILNGIFSLFKGTLEFNDFLELLLNYSLITFPIALIWLFFDIYGWRNKYCKKIGLGKLLSFPPDLRGRWVGALNRDGESGSHNFVMEIKQSMTKIHVSTYSSRGESESVVDVIMTDKMGDDFFLCFLWEGKTGKLPLQLENSGKFEGYTILRFIEGERKMKGDYFTNRKPKQTMGYIEVKWEGYNLLKQFKSFIV